MNKIPEMTGGHKQRNKCCRLVQKTSVDLDKDQEGRQNERKEY